MKININYYRLKKNENKRKKKKKEAIRMIKLLFDGIYY